MRVIAAILLGGAMLASAPASAQFWGPPQQQGPWCAVYPGALNDTRWDCYYPSLEACRPNILAGTRGFCNPNPRYPAPQPKPHRRKH